MLFVQTQIFGIGEFAIRCSLAQLKLAIVLMNIFYLYKNSNFFTNIFTVRTKIFHSYEGFFAPPNISNYDTNIRKMPKPLSKFSTTPELLQTTHNFMKNLALRVGEGGATASYLYKHSKSKQWLFEFIFFFVV